MASLHFYENDKGIFSPLSFAGGPIAANNLKFRNKCRMLTTHFNNQFGKFSSQIFARNIPHKYSTEIFCTNIP